MFFIVKEEFSDNLKKTGAEESSAVITLIGLAGLTNFIVVFSSGSLLYFHWYLFRNKITTYEFLQNRRAKIGEALGKARIREEVKIENL